MAGQFVQAENELSSWRYEAETDGWQASACLSSSSALALCCAKQFPAPCNGTYAWTRACIWVRLEVPLESLRYQSPSSSVSLSLYCQPASKDKHERERERQRERMCDVCSPGPELGCRAQAWALALAHACMGLARPGQQRRGGRPGWQLPGPAASVIVVTA